MSNKEIYVVNENVSVISDTEAKARKKLKPKKNQTIPLHCITPEDIEVSRQ